MDDSSFFETSSFQIARDCFISQQIIVVVGPPGSGKTALIRHIALQLESHYQIVPIFHLKDISTYGDVNKPQLFVIDDVLGVFNLERDKISDLERQREQIEIVLDIRSKRSKLLMSCRLSVYEEAKEFGITFFETDNVVNLNSKENSLSDDDQKGIFLSQCRFARVSIELDANILRKKSELMFPLLCKLFCNNEKFRKYGSTFFNHPYDCLLSEIKRMKTHNTLQYFAMVLCMLHNNRLSDEDTKNKEIVEKISRSCRVKGTPQDWEILEQLSYLEGTYTTKNGEIFTFINDFIFEVVALQYGQLFPDHILDYLSSSFIANKVVIGNVGKELNHCITIGEPLYEKLAMRLYDDVKKGHLYDVFLNKTLKDPVFMEQFKLCLTRVPYTDVKNVFLSFRDECFKTVIRDARGKYREEDEDRDTTKSKWAAKIRQRILLDHSHNGIKTMYRIRVVSFIIYYGHVDLLKCLIDLVVLHGDSTNIVFGSTKEEQTRLLVLACFNGDLSTVKFLVENLGKKIVNEMPVREPERKENRYRCITPVAAACMSIKNDVVEYLRNIGADLNLKDCSVPALWVPANTGNLTAVVDFISYGADCRMCNDKGKSSVSVASSHGHLSIVKKLIKHGADINTCDSNGMLPLHFASQNGHLSVLETLIKKGANCHQCDKIKRSPLHVESIPGHEPIVKRLIQYGASVNTCDRNGRSSLYLASGNGHLSVVETLIKHGANCYQCDNDKFSPLHYASQQGHDLVVEKLLVQGEDVDRCDIDLWSPLHFASQNGHLSVVEKLIKHGANSHRLHLDEITPLHVASHEGHVLVVEKLIEQGADVGKCDTKERSALHFASHNGHLPVVKTLIEHGAKYDKCDKDGLSPLHFASNEGHGNIVRKLIEYGANVNKRDIDGWTPLYFASQNGHLSVVETLLKHEANCNQYDSDEMSPLYVASHEGHKLVVQKLLEHGADVHKLDICAVSFLY